MRTITPRWGWWAVLLTCVTFGLTFVLLHLTTRSWTTPQWVQPDIVRHRPPIPASTLPGQVQSAIATPPQSTSQAVSAAGAPAADDALTGYVLTEADAPIPGAILCDAAGRLAATTDQDGMYRFAARPQGTLHVAAAGFVSITVASRTVAESGSPVIIWLQEAATITGRVDTVQGGGALPLGLKVYAVPPDELGLGLAATDNTLRQPAATVDANGLFTIGNVGRHKKYIILAGGAGYCDINIPNGLAVTAPASSLELTVAPLCAVDVKLRSAASAPMNSRLFQSPGRGVQQHPQGRHGDMLIDEREEAAFAVRLAGGIAPPEQELGRDATRYFCAYLADTEDVHDGRLGPFRATFRLPGFRPVRTDLWAYKVTVGERVCQEITLEPWARFGSVDLEVHDPSGQLTELEHVDPVLTMYIIDKEELQRTEGMLMLQTPIAGRRHGETDRIASVPDASYGTKVELGFFRLQLEPPVIRVDPESIVEAVLRIPEMGTVIVRAQLPDGVEYLGPAALRVKGRTSDGASIGLSRTTERYLFPAAPYRLGGLALGDLEIQFFGPVGSEETTMQLHSYVAREELWIHVQ